MTSLEREADPAPSMEDVGHAVARQFGRVFASQVLWVESLPELLREADRESPTVAANADL